MLAIALEKPPEDGIIVSFGLGLFGKENLRALQEKGRKKKIRGRVGG